MWTAPGTMPSSHSSRSRTSTKSAEPLDRSRALGRPDLVDLGLDVRQQLAIGRHVSRKRYVSPGSPAGRRPAATTLLRVSPRARIALVVAVLALVAALAVTGVAVLSAEEVDSSSAAAAPAKPQTGFPPLALSFGAREDEEAQQLRRAADLYEAGRRAQPAKIGEAAKVFARHDSLEAKLGAAFAAWPASLDRIEQLGALFPRSALVQLHVGIARYWAGTGGAVTAWREARDVEPDTPYAVRAGDLLYRDFAPGLPVFVPSFAFRVDGDSLAEQLDSLRVDTTAARTASSTASPCSGSGARCRHAARSGRRCASLRGSRRARRRRRRPLLEGASGGAFSRLGPLTRRFPHFASVRFHLGVLLLWHSDVREAKRQLRLARRPRRRARSPRRRSAT